MMPLGNGVNECSGYATNLMQLTSQTATKSGRPTNGLMNLTYSYQASPGQMGAGSTAGNAGQLMAISNSTIGGTTESAAYSYDLVGRLATSNQTSNGSSAQRRFAYDRWGNRTSVWDATSGGTQIQSISLQQSGGAPTNRITSVTSGSTVNYSYDSAGNTTNDGVHSYTYDAENRVVSVDSGSTAQYKYDNQNRRVSKIIGSSWTHYLWQGSQVIAQHDATTGYTTNPTYQVNSARLDYVYSGSQMISSRERTSSGGSWTTKYYLSDRLSTRLVLDTSGNVLGRMAHLPFGEDFGESGAQEKHHFTSYERDSEASTDYAVNRQYSQSTGRFRSADPYRASGYLVDPQSWNRYSYVGNDPVNYNDALGSFRQGVVPPSPPPPFGDPFGDGTGGDGIRQELGGDESGVGGSDDPTTAIWHAQRIKEAISLAFVKLIDSIPCQALLSTRGFAALPTLGRLQGRISEGNAHGKIAEYYCGLGCLMGRNPGSITLDGVNFFGNAIENDAANHNVTIAEAQAETILHELAHAIGAMSGNEDAFDERIYNTCIKPH